jgi:hypothetical protein
MTVCTSEAYSSSLIAGLGIGVPRGVVMGLVMEEKNGTGDASVG